MFLITVKDDPEPVGICGLMKREDFDEPDLGFAFLKRFRQRGFASESARAVLNHGFDDLGLDRIIAIADPANQPSLRVLEKLGFHYERKVRMPDDDFDINLYAIEK